MISAQQVKANRRNSQNSTGPRTAAGKSTVSRNATRHGLAGVHAILPGESEAEFEQLLIRSRLELLPENSLEHALVDQIAYAQWKLLRIAAWETDIIEATLQDFDSAALALFGDNPPEALVRLQRYESTVRRAWHNAIRELRLQQKARLSTRDLAAQGRQVVANYMKMIELSREEQFANSNPISHSDELPLDPEPPPSALFQPPAPAFGDLVS